MIRQHKTDKVQDIQNRAAEIRSHWSPLEKLRRTGLPPDVPAKLRQFILGSSEPNWSVVGGGGWKGYQR